MSENTKTDKTATVQPSSNKSATPLIVPSSEIKIVAPKMVELRKAVDSTSRVGTFGGIIHDNSEREK